MKKKKWGVPFALVVIALVVGWFAWSSGDDRLLWSRSYGANMARATLSPEGRLVVVAAEQVEVIDGDRNVETILSRPTTILEFVDQYDSGFLIIDRFEGQEWLRKYTWDGELLWERPTTYSLRQIKSSRDGHIIGVINHRELALFDPNGNLSWKKTDAPRHYDCLGFTGSSTIAYRMYGIDGLEPYESKTI